MVQISSLAVHKLRSTVTLLLTHITYLSITKSVWHSYRYVGDETEEREQNRIERYRDSSTDRPSGVCGEMSGKELFCSDNIF